MGMDVHEDQTAAAVKTFINKYQRLFWWILIGFAVVAGGTRYWQQNRLQRSAAASDAYQQMLIADSHGDQQIANAKGQYLMEDHTSTPYAQFAALLMAKNLANANELDQAAEKLRWVLAQPSAKKVAGHLATLRLAAVLQAQGKLDEALEILSTKVDGAFAGLYEEARGDVYLAKQDLNQAKDAYTKAIASLPPGVPAPLLQLKLADLGVENNA